MAETRKDFLSGRILDTIRRDHGFSIFSEDAVAISELEIRITQCDICPDAAILVGADDEIKHVSSNLLVNFPSLVVLRVSIGEDVIHLDAHYDVRQPGLEELVAAVRGLVALHGIDPNERLLDYAIGAPLIAARQIDYRVVSPRVNLIDRALTWIDATLLAYVRCQALRNDDLPGLTISQATVESLIAGPSINNDPIASKSRQDSAAANEQLLSALESANSDLEPIAVIKKQLSLSALEVQAFLLYLAPELDSKYQLIYGYLHNDMSRRSASYGLVCSLLGESVVARSSLATSNNLLRWRLVTADSTVGTSAEELLRVDPAIAVWILGNGGALLNDARIRSVVHSGVWPGAKWLDPNTYNGIADRLRGLMSAESSKNAWIVLAGSEASWWRALVEANGTYINGSLIRVLMAVMEGLSSVETEEAVLLLARAVRVSGAVLTLDATGVSKQDTISSIVALFSRYLENSSRPRILISPQGAQVVAAIPDGKFHVLQIEPVKPSTREFAFKAAATEAKLNLTPKHAEDLAASYAFSLDNIGTAVRLAAASSINARNNQKQFEAIVSKACRTVAYPALPQLARRLDASFSLDDVVLPKQQIDQLEEIIANVQFASKVLDSWGFDAQLPYGRGVSALFSGPSGTGKTMAAQAIAGALQTDIFAVDLSRVVSKYIGETEKNLDSVFGEAERACAVLCFDEADALFGKRSEIKDAHDRYANIEVAYLLQRMETFSGLAILTTNFGQNLDQAFLRRLRFVVEFPEPDAIAREWIWEKCLRPPAPVDDNLDFKFLARRLKITGGNIRQITLRAAFAAAGRHSKTITMGHIVEATRAELTKLGMQSVERELQREVA